MRPRAQILGVILVFVLVALPFAASFAVFYPDERHYLDGGLAMARDGDWLTPKHAEGTPRFEKPPLAYWLVAGSYRLLGVNILAAHLPFLLAGAGTLWLTWQLARRLTGSDARALLAALVLVSHPQFLLCSVRSMPDVLLTLFITLSASGFIRLIIFAERRPAVFWMAYGGAAGAVLSKGLLGVGVILYAWAFALWFRREPGAFKKLIHWPSLLVSLVIALGWFVYIWCRYGNASLATFFDDQVTGNFHGHWWDPAIRMGEYAVVLLLNFLPWSLPAVEQLGRSRFRMATQMPRPAQWFLLAWAAILVLGFPLGENVSFRYLLPAAPLAAILLGDWLPGAEQWRCVFSLRRLFGLMLGFLVVADVAGWIFVRQWPGARLMPTVLFGLFLANIALLGWWGWGRRAVPLVTLLAVSVMCFWLMFFTFGSPLFMPETAQKIAARLVERSGDKPKAVLVVGERQLASRLRTVLGLEWRVAQVDKVNPAVAGDFPFVLGAASLQPLLPGQDWRREPAGFLPLLPPANELWRTIHEEKLGAALEQHGHRINLFSRD